MVQREYTEDVVYFPDTDEKYYIVNERKEDGTLQHILITEEEFLEVQELIQE